MYADFCLVAADQLFNQAAKVRHMFGGDHDAPLILRARVAAGGGYGSQHSMDPSGVFALWPGWRIVAPTTPFDYVGLFNSAVRCNDPVAIIECQALYQEKSLVPEGPRLLHPLRQGAHRARRKRVHGGDLRQHGAGERRRGRRPQASTPR